MTRVNQTTLDPLAQKAKCFWLYISDVMKRREYCALKMKDKQSY